MIKLCVFDLDGTLADTIDSMAYPANRALKELGLPELPYEGFRYYAGARSASCANGPWQQQATPGRCAL